MRRRTAWTLFALSPVVLALSWCAVAGGLLPWQWPQGAPPSAALVTPMTAAGITALFQRECIEQRDAAWAASQRPVRRAYCGTWLGNPDHSDEDHCLTHVMPVSWTQATSDGSTVFVQYDWDAGDWAERAPPKGQLLDCTITLFRDPGPALPAAVARLRLGGRPLVTAPAVRSISEPDVSDAVMRWRAADAAIGSPVIAWGGSMTVDREAELWHLTLATPHDFKP